jgi:CubicO group peptidase (beta-lactamase class C family)
VLLSAHRRRFPTAAVQYRSDKGLVSQGRLTDDDQATQAGRARKTDSVKSKGVRCRHEQACTLHESVFSDYRGNVIMSRKRIGRCELASGWTQVIAIALTLLAFSPSSPSSPLPNEQVQDAIDALDEVAPQWLERSGVPGMAIAVVNADSVLYLRDFGVRRAGELGPVDPDTVFQLASVSKPISSTLIAGLVGDGIVNWSTPVASLVPEFRLSNSWVNASASIADGLSHRTGLPDHAGDLLEDLVFSQAQILDQLGYLDLAPFRISYAYTNFAFTAAGLAAAAAAHQQWADLADQRLFAPLGMTRSSYRFADYIAKPNRAAIHAYVDGSYEPLYERDADAQAPAGCASASVTDVATWLRLQLGDGRFEGEAIINPDALLQTHLPQVVSGPAKLSAARSDFYGLGWIVSYDDAGRVRLSHSGAFALGAATTLSFYPSEDIGIAVLTNGAPYGLAEATARSFFDCCSTES